MLGDVLFDWRDIGCVVVYDGLRRQRWAIRVSSARNLDPMSSQGEMTMNRRGEEDKTADGNDDEWMER